MEAREIIKDIMSTDEVTNAELARRLDITRATVWDRLNNKKGRKDIPVSLLKTMLSALGYKIVVVPDETPIPEGGYEVGQTDMVG